MRKFITAVFAAVFLTAVLGCATLDQSSTESLETVKLGLDIKALSDDMDEALEALLFNDWTEDEARQIEYHIGKFQELKDALNVLEGSNPLGSELLVNPQGGRIFLEQVAIHFNSIRNLYIGYTKRVGIRPDPALKEYSDRGVAVWRSMMKHVVNGGQVKVSEFSSLLQYVVRGYVLYKTGGVGI